MTNADEIHVMTSPAFDFTSSDMPTNLRYVGPQLDDPAWTEAWESPWAADDPRPLVLVGLSSTFQDQARALNHIVEALATLPVRGLVTLGKTIPPSAVVGSANVTIVCSAPHNVLIPQASALVTLCGHGTTMKGLAAGVPLVCMPMGRDQNDTAARVVHRGAGLRLKPTATADAIREAVVEVLANPKYRESAKRLAGAIRGREGCIEPIDALERLAARA